MTQQYFGRSKMSAKDIDLTGLPTAAPARPSKTLRYADVSH